MSTLNAVKILATLAPILIILLNTCTNAVSGNNKAKDRIAELENQNQDYQDIINDVVRQKSIYIAELKEIKKKYGK